MSEPKALAKEECLEIAELLGRRANEISIWRERHDKDGNMPGSVELALSREMTRLRGLQTRLKSVAEPEKELP